MKKNVYIVADNGSEAINEVEVANDIEFDRMLKRFRGVSLRHRDTGREIFGHESLQPDEVYMVVKEHEQAPYPHGDPRPRSPPRDGIETASTGVVLSRTALVSSVIDENHRVVIVHSSPATGKTSLLDLTARTLRLRHKDRKVIRFPVRSTDASELLKSLMFELGVNAISEVRSLDGETWILIDDAQLAFEAHLFWVTILKDLASGIFSSKIRFVIAATYDLASQGSTPYAFSEHPHVYNLKLTDEEAKNLYDGYMKEIFFAGDWPAFKDTILRLAGGHVGVLTAGINMLFQMYQHNQKKPLEEDEVLSALRDHRFRSNLQRIFPRKELMTDEQRKVVSGLILNGPRCEPINPSQGSMDDEVLVQLVRAGILSVNGAFSCLSSQWHYCNTFYKRPATPPASIEDLVIKAVQSMSALRLRQSCGNEKFPKEAAFQHLFSEALTLQVPANVPVCPELNTFARDDSGNVKTGELDFFVGGEVNGDLRWAIEITRKGDKINEHVSRFDPSNGKYRAIGHTAWIVVDCRGPRVKQVEMKQARCTLYFAEDFQTAECKMRLQPIQTIILND